MRNILKIWFRHFKDPFTTVYWLFFRPYRYLQAWEKFENDYGQKISIINRAILSLLLSFPVVFLITPVTLLILQVSGLEVCWGCALLGVELGVAVGVAVGVAGGVAVGVAGVVALGVAEGVAWSVGVLRIVDWILWLIAMPFAILSGVRTPLSRFNGYLVFPLFGGDILLYRSLKNNFRKGLEDAFEVAFNPFQRWVFQKGVKRYFVKHIPRKDILKKFREMRLGAKNGFWGEPAFPLLLMNPTRLEILLSELGLKPPEKDKWVWRLTKLLRDESDSVVSDLASAYYAMIFKKDRPGNHIYAFNRAAGEKVEGAEELIWTYETLDKALECESVKNIESLIPEIARYREFSNPLQPEVMEAFALLHDIAVDARAIHHATAMVRKHEAAVSAAGRIEGLRKFVEERVAEPEARYFIEALERWQGIISSEAYEYLKGEKLEPVPNPYIVGQVVTGQIFKGREDIFREITSYWNPSTSTLVPILLYGHRRMGKTSIARNLTEKHIGADYMPVYSSAQGYGENELTLLYHIASAFKRQMGIEVPQLSDFKTAVRGAFGNVIEEAREKRNGKIVIMVIDEFEEIEDAIRDKRINADFVNYLRNLSQENGEWLGLMLVGSHRLEEMTRSYWDPFWGSVLTIKVGFMAHDAAWELITNPVEDFKINYDEEIIERIIELTGGQPFLINKVCHSMIEELNRRIRRRELSEYPTLGAEYLKIALREVANERTNYYFSALWNQITEDERIVAQKLGRLILQRLNTSNFESLLDLVVEKGSGRLIQPCVTFDKLRDELNWGTERLEDAIRKLSMHDTVKPMKDECGPSGCGDDKSKEAHDRCLCFCVPLMLLWFMTNPVFQKI